MSIDCPAQGIPYHNALLIGLQPKTSRSGEDLFSADVNTNLSVCLSVCLSAYPHGIYVRTLSNGLYIRSIRTILVRCIRPLRTLYTETYHTTRQIYQVQYIHDTVPSHHAVNVPYGILCFSRSIPSAHTIPYTVLFPYTIPQTYPIPGISYRVCSNRRHAHGLNWSSIVQANRRPLFFPFPMKVI